jgi:hypothetical protein
MRRQGRRGLDRLLPEQGLFLLRFRALHAELVGDADCRLDIVAVAAQRDDVPEVAAEGESAGQRVQGDEAAVDGGPPLPLPPHHGADADGDVRGKFFILRQGGKQLQSQFGEVCPLIPHLHVHQGQVPLDAEGVGEIGADLEAAGEPATIAGLARRHDRARCSGNGDVACRHSGINRRPRRSGNGHNAHDAVQAVFQCREPPMKSQNMTA